MGIICGHFTGKKGETTRWKNNMLAVDHFFSFWFKKNKSSFSFMVNYPHLEDRRAAFSVDPKSWPLRLGRLSESCQGVLPRAYYFHIRLINLTKSPASCRWINFKKLTSWLEWKNLESFAKSVQHIDRSYLGFMFFCETTRNNETKWKWSE